VVSFHKFWVDWEDQRTLEWEIWWVGTLARDRVWGNRMSQLKHRTLPNQSNIYIHIYIYTYTYTNDVNVLDMCVFVVVVVFSVRYCYKMSTKWMRAYSNKVS
jgi:hypothetical protein